LPINATGFAWFYIELVEAMTGAVAVAICFATDYRFGLMLFLKTRVSTRVFFYII